MLPHGQEDAALRPKDWSEYLSSGEIAEDIETDDFMKLIDDLTMQELDFLFEEDTPAMRDPSTNVK